MEFSREALKKFLIDKNIRTLKDLERKRVPNQDPSFSHYRKEFGKWTTAVAIAFGEDVERVFEKPPEDPLYILKVIVMYGLYTLPKYEAARKEKKDVVPSVYALKKAFSSIGLAFKCAQFYSLKVMAEKYLSLTRILGRTPSYEDCSEAGVDLTKILRVFKKKKKFDNFIKEIDRLSIKENIGIIKDEE